MKTHRFYFGSLLGFLLLVGCVREASWSRKPGLLQAEPPVYAQSVLRSELVQAKELKSSQLNMTLQYYVLSPPRYQSSARSTQTYPVMYWLHGGTGGDRSRLPLATHFHQAMREGTIPQMFIIFPDSRPQSMWINAKDGTYPIEDMLVKELVPKLKNSYPISNQSKDSTVAGFSMGGYGAARIGFKYPGLFGRIIMIGSGTLDANLDETPRARPEARDRILNMVSGGDRNYFYSQSPRRLAELNRLKIKQLAPSISIVVGDLDEVYDQNIRFSNFLNRLGIKHQWLVLPGVSHSLRGYIDAMGDSFSQLFTSSSLNQ